MTRHGALWRARAATLLSMNGFGDAQALGRHRALQVVLAGHVLVLLAYGALRGPRHVLLELVPIVALLVLSTSRTGRSLRLRATAASLGLYSCSAVVVHLAGGVTEAHFHFFVVLALVSLYRDIVPYVVGIGFVLVEHFVVGSLFPTAVFAHEGDPLGWAVLHAAFVGAASVAHVFSWRTVERTHADERRELTGAIERLAAIVDDAGIAIISLDLQGTILSWNAAAVTLFGHPCDQALGRSAVLLLPPGQEHELQDDLSCAREGRARSYEARWVTSAGQVLEMALDVSPVRDTRGEVIGASLMARDVTLQKQVERELERHQVALTRRSEELSALAFRDPLTGLANRALFLERLEQAHAQRPGGHCVVMLDLDGFKKVNDTAGHATGDALLVEVASRLLGCVRPSDTVARLGGDEFALLLAGLDSGGVATRVLSALSAAYDLDGRLVSTSASLGIALSDRTGTPDQLLRSADVALYAAKAGGKNRALTYSAHMLEAMMRRTQLEAGVREALAGGGFQLEYQPVVDLRTGEVEGFEALLRWPHPTLGSIAPTEVIGVAEDAGLMPEVGAWVLREATLEAGRLSRRAARPVQMAVNVSLHQLERADFPGVVAAALTAADLPPGQLVLEVTESALGDDVRMAVASLRAVRAAGVRVAIDDFGTGYSSLDRLRTFPVDVLKVDRSFIAEIGPAGASDSPLALPGTTETPLLTAIFAMAAALGLRTVAEGVETDVQYAWLRRGGCDLAQGFLMGRSLRADEAAELLAFSQPFADRGLGQYLLEDQELSGLTQLLVAAAGSDGAASSLEPLLEAVCTVTGLEASFLSTVDVAGDTQHVLVASPAHDPVVPEGDRSWAGSACRAAALSGRWASTDVRTDYPTAQLGDVRSYVGVPIFGSDGALRATLCAVDRAERPVDEEARRTLSFLSRLIREQVLPGAGASPRTVVVVDDSLVSRRLLETALEALQAYRLVGEAGSLDDGVRLCAQLRPDIVLLDVGLPDGDGRPAVQALTAAAPGARVVVVSASEEHHEIALALGASAFLNKAHVLDELGLALAPRQSREELVVR